MVTIEKVISGLVEIEKWQRVGREINGGVGGGVTVFLISMWQANVEMENVGKTVVEEEEA